MLVLAALVYYFHYHNRNVPLYGPFSDGFDDIALIFQRDTSPTENLCPRKRLEIVWSCLATILASSWVAVHPNLPHPDDSKIKRTLRRIELMLWAIITPELIIYWAMRQWYGARWMEKDFAEYLKKGYANIPEDNLIPEARPDQLGVDVERGAPALEFNWTKTHGFFLQMGGLMLQEEGKPKMVLGWYTLLKHHQQGRIDLSEVTEARINDRSKADGFSKGLALLQTFWFIVQCIARLTDQDLVLTELELVTAALAALSLIMYALWWNKPFNAEVPIVIKLSHPQHVNPKPSRNTANVEPRTKGVSMIKDLMETLCQCTKILHRIRQFLKDNGTIAHSGNPNHYAPVVQVPALYSIKTVSDLADIQMRLLCFSVASLFGVIHCAGFWSTKFHFSSHAVSLLWQISSAIITGAPIIWSLYFIFEYAWMKSEIGSISGKVCRLVREGLYKMSIGTIPFYIVSRIILLFLACMELHAVPPGALSTIKWANVLPFIH